MEVLKSIIPSTVVSVILGAVLVACSSDDEEPPPPAVDCGVTGPTLTLTATSTNCGLDDGTIELMITGGTGNLEVTIDPQPLDVDFSNNTFSNVEPGTYTIEVTDTDNCNTNATTVVDLVAGNVSYMDSVDPIIQANCAVSGCHVAGTGLANFTVFAELQARANNLPGGVRQRVKTDDMPRDRDPLTAEQKEALFCWIDEGAQNN